MTVLVQKFGGTSLANVQRINHAADLVMKARQAGHDVVVVVSAMSGETDRLIGLATEINDHSECPSSFKVNRGKDLSLSEPREYAALVATGEQVTMALMAMALIKRGVPALSFTGAQAGIVTCNQYKKARIQSVDPTPILRELKQGKVVVVAGFQGVDAHGHTTTLGRGGSDTTAVALAAALNADECQIFTDVEGIYTTDPNVEPQANRLAQITFEEMLELASLGSKVLQIRSVEFAGKYNVPLRVLSSLQPGVGTLISYPSSSQPMESPLVSGIAFSRYEAKITLLGEDNEVNRLSTIVAEVSELGINIDMLGQHMTAEHRTQVTFTVHRDEYQQTLSHFQQASERLNLISVKGEEKLAKLSLVGAGLKSHPSVAATMFGTLTQQKIQIQLMAMSEIKLSVIIDVDRLDEGVRSLHKAFHLDQEANRDQSSSLADETSIIYSEN